MCRNSYAGAIHGRLEGIVRRVAYPQTLEDVSRVPPAQLDRQDFFKRYGPEESWSLTKVKRIFGQELAMEVLTAVHLGDRRHLLEVVEAACLGIEKTFSRWREAVDDWAAGSWLAEDPSRQYSSSFNPALVDVREFYQEYREFNIGLTDDEYVALRLLRRNHPMPKDVFQLLCVYCLFAKPTRK